MWATLVFALCSPSSTDAFSTAGLTALRGGSTFSTGSPAFGRALELELVRRAYRLGDESEADDAAAAAAMQQGRGGAKRLSRWWSSMFRTPVPNEARDVDEYLEFLDRRYHRLHDKPESKTIKFSAWAFLTEKPEQGATPKQQEDALFVLGLAGLASERLLEKHHIALHQATLSSSERPRASSSSMADSNAVDAEVFNSSRASMMASSPLMNASADVLRKLSATRQRLIDLQTEKLRSAMRLLIKALQRFPSKVIEAFLHMGGGKRTLTLTCGAIVSAIWLVRPVVQAMVKPGPLSG